MGGLWVGVGGFLVWRCGWRGFGGLGLVWKVASGVVGSGSGGKIDGHVF